jgi:hypothetical protein
LFGLWAMAWRRAYGGVWHTAATSKMFVWHSG